MPCAPPVHRLDPGRQIAEVMELAHAVLGRTMIGAYVYGSSLLGGLGPRSDLDILIVTCAPTSVDQKQELARGDIDDLEHDTGNVLLTLACIWTTVETNRIRSKDSAANWVIARVPREHHPVMIRARDIYVAHNPDVLWADLETRVTACDRYLVESIRNAVKNDAYPTNRPLSLGV